jgi:hypothetical protein
VPIDDRRRLLAGDKKRVRDGISHAVSGLGSVDTSRAGSAGVFIVRRAVVLGKRQELKSRSIGSKWCQWLEVVAFRKRVLTTKYPKE